MKLRSLFLISLLIFCLVQCNSTITMEKYVWYPTECAPKCYPAEIINADFYYPDGESIYIPKGRLINNGWGQIGSTHLVGDEKKPIPNKLNISWFSYTENKFYAGVFDLPFQQISALFSEGFKSPLNQNQTTYQYIITGLAPGGFITIWLAGDGLVTEVVNFKANETKINWNDFFDNPEISRQQFVDDNLKESMSVEKLSALKKEGVPLGLWKSYSLKSNWSPVIVGRGAPRDLWINSFNGERQYINYELPTASGGPSQAIPQKTELRWKGSNNLAYSATIDFNETEIFEACAKLNIDSPTEPLKLQFQINDFDQSVKVFLNSDKYSLELLKPIIKVYSN